MENSHKISQQLRILTILLILFLTHTILTNAQNAVGSVNGALTVNDMGAAVYSMTFDAPNGGRMTPKIGLAYSSQSSGYGLAGYGIDVTGISVITSGGRDMFHNGKVRGANYDKDSNFYLDGKRLVLQAGEDGEDGTVYAPEGDPYTKVTLHGDIDLGTAYFEVIATDGTVFTYGGDNNSRLQVSKAGATRTATWYVTMAVNRYGESITYTYSKENMCVRPLTITYGNGSERGLTAEVKFFYRDMADANVRTFRIGSQQGMRNKLLSSVTTSINNQVHRKYDFTYDETAGDKFSRLVRITESNGAGESLNPTELTWNTETISPEPIHSVSSYETVQPYSRVNKETSKSTYFSVDLDGDGISEGIRVCMGTVGSAQHTLVFVSHGYLDDEDNVRFSTPRRYTLPYSTNFGQIECIIGALSVMDHDGDGLNDLAFPYFVGGTMVRLCVIYGSSVRNFSDYYGWLDVSLAKADEMPLFANMDMNGDGRDDVLVFEKSDTNGAYAVTSIQYDKAYGPNSGGVPSGRLENCHRTMLRPLSQPKKIFTGDYNNDGLSDILTICDNGYTIYYNNGYTDGSGMENVFSDANKYDGTSVKSYWRMEQGDFDGDGLVDFFCYDKDSKQFHIAYYNGDGTFHDTILPDNWGIYDQAETDKDDDKFSVIVTDFDNDGKSDVVISKAMYDFHHGAIWESSYYRYNKTLIRWLRSMDSALELTRAFEFNGEEESYESYFFGGDFNGDGRLELANYGRRTDVNADKMTDNAIHIYRFGTKDAARSRLVAVFDGFGNSSSVDYRYYAKRVVGYSDSQYPLNSYSLPIPVVSTVKSKDFSMEYLFDDLKIHVAGGGVMGFSYVEKNDMVNDVSETSQITAWNTKKWKPSEIKKKKHNLFAHKTATTKETYKFVDDSKGNCVSYMSERVAIGYDYDTITTKSTFDKNLLMVTETKDNYGTGNKMYKSKGGSNYVACGTSWIPTVVTAKQVHPDNSSSTYKTVTKYAYDAFGNPLIMVSLAGTACADTVRYTYDRWGNVTSETFHGNDETTGYKYYEYDPTGRFIVKTYTVPESTTTTYTYDIFGNLLTETDETNLLHPLTTTHMYDNWGRREHTIYPDGTETYYYTEWEDDNNIGGWFTEEWHTAAPWVRVTYDSQGRDISTYTYGPNYVNRYQLNIYDKKGRIARTESINGKQTSAKDFEYDARGRVIREQSSSGAGATYVYGKNSVTVTDAAGRTVKKTYDAWGNVKSVEEPAMNIEYKYYSNGKPHSITTDNSTIKMEYDELGRRTKIDDPDAGETVTTYYKNGQLKSETDGRGIETSYIYDDLGRITERRRKNTKDTRSEASVTTYTYGTSGNGKGRVTEKSLGYNKVTYEYDELGRVISETRPQAYNHDGTRDDMRKSYTYNRQGLLATVNYPASHSASGLTIGYRYDGNGYRTKTLLDNNDFNRLSWIKESNGEKTVVRSDYLGDVTTYYDEDGYPESDSYVYGNSIRDTLYYTWEKQTGNLISKTIKGKAEEYGYDNLDRLTDVRCNGLQTMGVDYADNGNIVYKTDVGDYTYDPLDKPHAVRSVDNTDNTRHIQDVSFSYHPNGKLEYAYNKSNNAFVNYDYGPDDEKWGSVMFDPDDKEIKGWDIEHIYWGNYERLTKDYHIREYYFLDNDVFLMRDNPHIDAGEPDIWDMNYYQMERDNIGNIVAIYDLYHRKVFEAEYDAWGKQTVIKDEICFNHGFTGHEMLPQFGVIHMDGRLYDPTIGRFLSPDNYVQLPENSQSFNRYSYCINNPLKYTDPSGQLFGIDDAVLIFGTFNLFASIIHAKATGQNIWKAAGISILSSAASYGIGGIFGATGNFGHELLRAGAHGLASGVQNALAGENFGVGFASGAFASFAGSGAQWARLGTYGVLGSTTLFGGIGSVVFGGDFLDGAMTGLQIGFLNDVQHMDGGCLPEVVVTGKAKSNMGVAIASMAMVCVADDVSGLGVIDDVAIPVFAAAAGAYWTYEHRADIEKGITRAYNSISTMATKTMECRPGYVYHLVATTDGWYPNVRGGNVHLKAGETWKIGETVNGSRRYPQNYLNDLNVKMVPSSGPMTNKYQLWIEEKRQLIKYVSKYGSLPPGNKMFK